MSAMGLLTSSRYASGSGDVSFTRPNFRVYAHMSSSVSNMAIDGYEYYKSRGLGLIHNFYNNGGFVTESGVAVYVRGAFGARQTTADVDSATLTIPVDSTSQDWLYGANQIRIDEEQMLILSYIARNLTVTRAYNGTTAASHVSGASVIPVPSPPGRPGALVDLWYMDNEYGGYTWDVAGATTCIADTASVTAWGRSYLGAIGSRYNPPKIGAYSGAPAGLSIGGHGSAAYYYTSDTQQAVDTMFADYNACGQYVSALWDFALPENYTNRIDEYAATLERYASIKRINANPIKLYPLVWPTYPGNTTSMSYEFITALLEYSIRIPECDGVAFWAVSDQVPAAAPVYYNSQPWMTAILDFIDKYGLTLGTPF